MNHYIYHVRFRSALCAFLTVVMLLAAVMLPGQALAATRLTAIDGNAAILVDAQTGTVLYEQNADQQIAPASTTKIMTGLLVVEAVARGEISMTDLVTLTDEIMHDVPSDASRIGNAMVVGEQVTVRDLLYMALMESDCVACDMLAVHTAGSVQSFVGMMNLRAQQLGCRGTNFLNSHGYPTEGHTSTARSLYIITAEAAQHELFMEAFGCLKYVMTETNMTGTRTLYSTDKLLYDPSIVTSTYTVYFNEYVTGGKTGYSRASGNCLVSTAEKDGMSLISVITGVDMKYPDEQTVIDAFTESDRLLMWGFDNYSSHRIVSEGETVREVEVKDSMPESIAGICADAMYVTLEKGVSPETIQVTAQMKESVLSAPVSSGDLIGTVSLMTDGKVIATADLLAGADAQLVKREFEPNVPAIVILSILVAAGAAFLVYYTNQNNIILTDLAKEKLGMTAAEAKPKTAAAKPRTPKREEEPVTANVNPFDAFFGRNVDDE